MLFADVLLDVVEFFLLCLVVVDEFPSAEADGTVEADGGAVVSPDVWIVPYQRTAL